MGNLGHGGGLNLTVPSGRGRGLGHQIFASAQEEEMNFSSTAVALGERR